jgi:hypothetical protein
MLNAIGRDLPEHVDAYGRVISFARAFAARPTTRRHAPPVKTVRPRAFEIALLHYAIDGLLLDRLTTPIDPDLSVDQVVEQLVRRLLV